MTDPTLTSNTNELPSHEEGEQTNVMTSPNTTTHSDNGLSVPEHMSVAEDKPQNPPPTVPSDKALGEIVREISQLRQLFRDKIVRDKNQEAVVKNLHEALITAQNDLVWKILRPVLLEVVRLYDDLVSAQRHAPSPVLEELVKDAEDILARQGFNQYSCDSDTLVPSLQKVRRTVPTEVPADVGRIVERILPGFRSDDYILRPEEVAAYASLSTNQPHKNGS